MRPSDLLFFLLGYRGSIERIAADRRAWLIGAILVLTAGIARNYDHLYFPQEPETFVGPFVASLFSTVFIFIWANCVLRFRKLGESGLQLLVFLSLFWLTAPCAWLYGIPVESWTDLLTATKWNVAFLAIVSIWRVALITRSTSVLTGVHWLRCLCAILAPASLEMWIGSYFQSLSLVGIMGGVRLHPHHEYLLKATEFTMIGALILFFISVVATPLIKSGQQAAHPLHRAPATHGSGLWIVAPLILTVWVLVSIPMQAKVRNRYHLETLLRSHQYEEAIRFAAQHSRSDFPHVHFFPPDPYQNRFDLELYTQIPNSAPEWLKREWHENAVTSLKESLGSFVEVEEWKTLEARRPDLVAEIRKFAEQLRSQPSRSYREARWLKEFEELERESPTPTL